MASILETIIDMEARLSELRRQLTQGPSHYSGRVPYAYSQGPVNAVPLQAHVPHVSHARAYSGVERSSRTVRPARPVRHDHQNHQNHQNHQSETTYPTVPLSAVLVPQDIVTFQVILRKGDDGQPVYASFDALYDASCLKVVRNDLVASMIDQQSSKPGELLYRFIEALKEGGHLKRTFTVAPWKLCTVVRDGVSVTLESLRRKFLETL